jgi:hypothetical protein
MPLNFPNTFHFIVTLSLNLLAFVAGSSRQKTIPTGDSVVFRHSIGFRGFAYFAGLIIPNALSVLVYIHPPQNNGDVIAIVCVYSLFALLAAPLLWEAIRFSFVISPIGLICTPAWRRTRLIPWSELKDVSFSMLSNWFIFRSADDWRFRVYLFVPGLSELLSACESRLAPDAFKKAKSGYSLMGRPFPGVWPQ